MNPGVKVSRATLGNGLRVVTVALPHLHTATVALFVKVGSRYESSADNGLSHFVEHMLYRGTKDYPSSYDLNFAFESLGSALHAETGRDYSVLQVAVPPERIDEALELFGELLLRPRFGDIELERQLILEEVQEDFNERGAEINSGDIARGLAFEGNPLGQRIIGPADNVERFGVDDVRRHFERFYCAANMVLAVAGPIDSQAITATADRALSRVCRGEEATATTPAMPRGGPRFVHISDPGAQTSIDLLWRALPELDPGYPASVALSRALDDGMASRLHYRICDQLGLAYSLSATLEPLHDAALLEVTGSTSNKKAPQLITEVLSLMRELCTSPISDRELDKIRRRSQYDLACTLDDPGSLVAWYGGTSLFYPPPSLEERARRLDAVTPQEIMDAAAKILQPDNLVAVVVGTLSPAQKARAREAVVGALHGG